MHAMKATTSFLFLLLFSLYALEAKEWNHSSGSYKSERYFAGDQITPYNVSDLEIAWRYTSGRIDE